MNFLRRMVESVVGRVSWTPPGWLGGILSFMARHRNLTVIAFVIIGSIAGGGWWGWRYYKKLPKPRTVAVSADPLPVTRLEKEIHPPALVLNFNESAAPIEVVNRPVPEGISIEPAVHGFWRWEGDRRLVFRTREDWPADTTYRVRIAKNAVAPHLLLNHYTLDVATPKFSSSFKKLEFYQDPKDQTLKTVVATLEFTHGVDPAELEKNLVLSMVGGSSVLKPGVPPFTVDYGLHHRVAFVHSAPLSLPEREDFMKVTVSDQLRTAQGGAKLRESIEKKVRIPDLYSFFHIDSVNGLIIRNNDGDPEQFLAVETTAEAKPEEIAKGLEVYLLPKKIVTEETDESEAKWGGAREVDSAVLQRSTPVTFTLVPSKEENTRVHAFKIKVELEGSLYVKVRKGVRAQGEFILGSDYDNVIPVPEPEPEIAIQGNGGVLALNGDRKLSVKSRGIDLIHYEIARVPADQINHLVSQTRGEFQNPEFVNYRFDEENIARIATETQTIAVESRFKTNYSVFDFARHLQPASDGGSPMQGLFFLRAEPWDPKKNEATSDICEKRFILVTDIGILVKANADGSRDVYLQSLKAREPMAGVEVQVLAKNGVPTQSGTTGADGHVAFASLGKPEHEKQPVAIVARNGSDVSFITYARDDRQIDFSNFDIAGVESVSGKELEAFVFTERGVYRPGDEIHTGFIVKQRDWGGQLEGLPVETEVKDSRGLSVLVKQMAMPAGGFAEFSYRTAYESPTGDYEISVYLVRDGKRSTLLGSTSALVKEFLPDRMKIESGLLQSEKPLEQNGPGWFSPNEIAAAVTLRNLYGTPATGHRLAGRLALSPARFQFGKYKDYSFFDQLNDGKQRITGQTVELGDKQTGDDGSARFDLQLERFTAATYEMTFYVEGFEAEGGRSVNSRCSVMVSPLSHVIGYKPDGDLSYVDMDSEHSVEFIAIDRALAKIAVENLTLNLIEKSFLSVLTRQEDGTYAYESVPKEKVIHSETVSIQPGGFKYVLPTGMPGNYLLELREKDSDIRLGMLGFHVAGHGAVSRSLDKNAELDVKLSSKQYNEGDQIEMSITAPYAGSGLITIERDKVYAHQWFKTDTTGSIQHIKLPDGFDGTGYVNVSFIRALDSKEVFMNPLSYCVVPFTANKERRKLKIDLDVSPLTKPGEPLHLRYKTDRPAKIVVYAVDEGILQVTGYELPDPLGYFFRKSALMVNTYQIVDLLLPEYSVLRSTAFGGDGDERRLNPFKRVTEKPVVFWSGIIDSDTTEREVVYNVPDYFNGTLKVMAVAYSPEAKNQDLLQPFQVARATVPLAIAAVSSAEQESIVRGPFVITPGVPTLAAPGDTFEAGVTIANNVTGSGSDAKVTLTTEPSEHLEIIKAPAGPLTVPEGREISVVLEVRAKDVLGSASLRFTACNGSESASLRSTLSVRPAVPLMTQVTGGNFTRPQIEAPINRRMYPQYRQLEAVVSGVPLGLAHGLDAYLKDYPNGCSEQITSGAFCRLMLSSEADFGLSRAEVFAQLDHTYSILRRRQNDQGAFGYWVAEKEPGIDFISTYVMHFLVEAKEDGFVPPQDVYQAGLRYLQKMVAMEPRDLWDARTIAYAIYVLTRDQVITTNYILNLRDYLDKKYPKTWQNDLTGVYLAGSLILLKEDAQANQLIAAYKMGGHNWHDRSRWSDFYQPLGSDSQYLAVLARHFPDRLNRLGADEFQGIIGPVNEGRFNTLTAAYAVLALKSYSQHLATMPVQLNVKEVRQEGGKDVEKTLEAPGKLLKRTKFSSEARALRFSMAPPIKGMGAYYQVIETGFDLHLPDKPVKDGMEIYRELLGKNGKPIDANTNPARLGEPVTVRLCIRSLTRESIPSVAIMDLLPGGFEITSDSLHPGAGACGCEYVDVREDRAVFFTSAGPGVRTITYQIKPCNRGQFVVPPVFAESMYDRTIKARGLGSQIRVIEAK